MPVPQQKFREIVFQILYSYELGSSKPEDICQLIMKELEVSRKVVQETQAKVKEIQAILEEIDRMISHASFSYEFNRIQTVEKNILRLGVYELFFDKSIPAKVAISEGIRLARKFGTPESAAFVNAILDTLYKASLGKEVDAKVIAETSEKLLKSEQNSSQKSQETLLKISKKDQPENESHL